MDVITVRDSSKSSFRAIAVEISDNTKESKNLIVSDSNMTSRDLAYSSLLDKTEELLGATMHKCSDGDISVAHIEILKEINDRDEYEFVESPNATAPAEVKVVTATKYEYPSGSGDEWAYYASTHLKAHPVAPMPPAASTGLTTLNRGCPLGTDDEWMYWWTKSLEDKEKADALAANTSESESCVPRGCPNGSKDEWAYWAHKSVEDKKRSCPRGTNDQWAYWVAESVKKNGEVRKVENEVHKRASTPTRKCPYGSDDQWAYWAWRHSEAKGEAGDQMVEEVEAKDDVEIEAKSVKDFPPGSGDLWAHFDRLFRDKEYAKKYQRGGGKRSDLEVENIMKAGSEGVGKVPKGKVSAYATWLGNLNIE